MVGPHDHLYPTKTEATERYYFALRGNTGGFYIHLHKSDDDEPLLSSRSYNYKDAQREADRLNEEHGYIEPADDDFRLEDMYDQF